MVRNSKGGTRGYTLVEMILVIALLGIAAALVIPTFGSVGVLRVQAAVRTVVADITVAQSDAVALQKGRGIVFENDNNDPRYTIAEVNGGRLDTALDRLTVRHIGGKEYGDTTITAINFPSNTLVFDELGGPVDGPGSSTPAAAGYIDIRGSEQTFRINVDAYTGRVQVTAVPNAAPPAGGAGSGG